MYAQRSSLLIKRSLLITFSRTCRVFYKVDKSKNNQFLKIFDFFFTFSPIGESIVIKKIFDFEFLLY